MLPMILFAQTYDSLWKQVKQAQQDDLPQTEQEVLRKIIVKAEKAKNYGQLLKAELAEAKAKCTVSDDSLMPAVERLKQREQQTRDEVLRAVYNAALGYIYTNNSSLGENRRQTAADYYTRALQNPERLAAVKTDDYTPLIIKGPDSRIYGHDLLSVVAYEAQRFDILKDYYLKAAHNRQAMLMASLEQLRTEQDEGYKPLTQSVWLQRIDSLIEAYSDLPEAGEAALARYEYMCQNTDATPRQKWDYLNDAIQRWGQWPRINRLRNARGELTTLQFHAKIPQRVALPGNAQQVKLTELRNISTLTMRVYQVKASAHDVEDIVLFNEKGLQKIKPLLSPLPQHTQTRTFSSREPYELFEDSMTLPPLPVGVYMLEFESTPKSRKTDRVFFYVSNLRLLTQALPEHQMRYVVVNATTGQPVAKAKLRLTDIRHNTTTLTTDSHGETIYQEKDYRVRSIYVTTDEDKASPQMNGYGAFSYYDNDRTLEHTEIFTDRAIYRPGQKVFVSALLYQTENGYQNSVVKGKQVTARLRDANHEVLEEKELTTDDYGTCNTEFTLPRKGLTGTFSVSIDRESFYFRVEEYKRPTFEVEMSQVKDNYADGDTLQVTGTARTYAGVPVQQAKVKYRVERRRAFWWMSYSYYWNQGFIIEESHDTEVASGEVTTDDNGTFRVPVPMVLPKTRYTMFYNFVVTAEVTDQGGETHETQMSLPLGNRKTAFTADIPKQVLTEKGASMTFHLRNAAGNDIDDMVSYRLDNGKWQTTATHTAVTLPQMKSGSHTVEAICNGDTVKQEITVFSLDDKRPAVETDDWFFLSDSQFPNNGTPVTLQVGSSDKDVHIVYTLIAGDDVIEQGAVNKNNELLNRKLSYRDEYGNGLLLTFAWVKGGKTYTHQATIKRPLPDTKLKLTWQTFRNRLKPGQQEEWTLVVTGPDGKPAKAQLLATLYDKSLDQLTPHNWTLQPYVWLPTPSSSWRYTTSGTLVCSGYTYAKSLDVPRLTFSTFDHDVYPSVFVGYGMINSRRMMARMKGSYAADEMMAIGAAPTMDTMEMEEADNGIADTVQEKAIGSMDVEETAPEQDMSAQVRENLNETAFFYPQLTTDSEGHIAIRFTLPESLTTWRIMGVAHTADMMTGTIDDEAVAQKDVMIQPNMPRFVRVGDKAQLTARIFNISEKEANATAHLLLSDPETGNILYSQEKAILLAAGSTNAVTFDYDCTDDSHPLLVAKMYVEGDGFSDGEQHYLPILPNREHVTVTLPFTQNEPGTKTIDLNSLAERSSKAPATITHSTLTLEYTNNPAWLMIQALPAVGHAYDDCALCQATSFYANAIGRHILAQNPNAKAVFESWASEQEEHTTAGTAGNSLQSALEKNDELKDLLLNETPWVTEAHREDEQKTRLADFFDTNLMQQRLASASDKLAALQGSDGAWSWWPGMSSSWYMTVEISEMLVRLNSMTGTHAEFQEMLDKAFRFMGNEVVDMVKEMKKAEKKGIKQTFPSHKALQWLYMCTIDGRQLPASVQSANTYLVNLLKKETRNQSIYDKAMSAIVLNNKTYIRSLKEYTVYREDIGRYYDTQKALYSWRNYRIPTQVAAIEALQRLTPEDTQTISEMQRWLLQEKRTQMWDTPINSADAIYAFLNGNSQTLQSQPNTIIKVDGQQVETSTATAGIGYVKTTMPGDGKQTVTAEKTSTGTSWGAVYLQFMQHTSDIEAQSSGITVKREILTSQHSPLTSHLSVGDRITVRITITADRDYDFLQVTDKRAACMEPVNQLSGYRWGYYLVPKDCSTNYFFDRLAKGKHVIETDYYIDRAGTYETGTCTAACTYAPEFRGTAPSERLLVKE